MGGTASTGHKKGSNKETDHICRSYTMDSVTDKTQNRKGGHSRTNTIHRIPTCPNGHKCIPLQNIHKYKTYELPDLQHLSEYSHPRYKCRHKSKCIHNIRLYDGGYDLDDRCHNAVYIHPYSRFVTDFDDEKTANSMTRPHTAVGNFRRIGVMICDGTCGSSITRGLWKCWQFRDLIWPSSSVSLPYSASQVESFTDLSHQMIQSVVALCGESFLTQLHELMENASNNNEYNSQKHKLDSNEHNNNFGSLLCEFSNLARLEMGINDDDFPFFPVSKPWHDIHVYGVLLGISNSSLKLRASQPSFSHLQHKKRRSRNLRHEIFTAGCKNSSRDLFMELNVNGFDYVLKIHSENSIINQNHKTGVSPNFSSLQEIAVEKLGHERHVSMGSPLDEEELLAILLFTGTSVGKNVVSTHRKYRNYCKWRVLQNKLMSAIHKLHCDDRQSLPNQLFHGLKKCLSEKNSNNNNKQHNENESTATNTLRDLHLFNTFVSTTSDHRLIESQFDSRNNDALLFLNCNDPVICCDVSWISKFPHEHEILFAPCALTVPSPFRHSNRQENCKKKKKKKKKSDCVEVNTHKNEEKSKKKHRKQASLAEFSACSFDTLKQNMSFSLVDGKLEAYSMSGDVFSPLDDINDMNDDDFEISFSISSDSQIKNNRHRSSIEITNPHDINKKDSFVQETNIHILADFLYGKSDEEVLWEHLDFNKKGFVDISDVQQLFLSLFLFAIQVEYSNEDMNPHSLDLRNLAQDYAQTFFGNMGNELGHMITKQYFISHAHQLHDLYEQFVGKISERARESSNITDDSVLHNPSFSESDSFINNNNSTKEDSNTQIIDDVECVCSFCQGNTDLQTLWEYFVNENSYMTHLQFDNIVYISLAFFVNERNPNAPLEGRANLELLITNLRTSLLSAYDPTSSGVVSLGTFSQFGNYLRDEYRKLRDILSVYKELELNKTFAKDREILEELNKFRVEAQILLGQLNNDLTTIDSPNMDGNARKKIHDMSNITFLIKEMKIRCNFLVNTEIRMQQAQLIKELDAQREYLQQYF